MASLSGARQSAQEARGLQFSQNIKSTLATDLVGEWSFDSGSGNQTNVVDDSGNGNNCTWNDVNPSPWTAGKVRGAGQFFGDNFASCGSKPVWDSITNEVTLEAWIWIDSFVEDSGIIRKGDGSWTATQYGLVWRGGWAGNRVLMQVGFGTSGFDYIGSDTLEKDKWYHIVGVKKQSNPGGKLYIYTNGVGKSKDFIYNGVSNNLPLEIGKWSTNFNGLIDEVRIYNRALTAYEIKALYAEGKMRHLADR